jgi:MFS family permease
LNRSPRVLLALAFASQSAISIVQWGLGALGPDLQQTYHLSAASLGALLSAAALGNALALVPAGVLIDRYGARPALVGGGLTSGVLLGLAGLAHSPWALGVLLLLFGVSGSLVAVAGAVSVFHTFALGQRGIALGVRQAAVSSGGLIAAFMLPGIASLAGVGGALGVSGVLTATLCTGFGLAGPSGPLQHAAGDRRRIAPLAVLRTPGMTRLHVAGFLLVCSLTTVLNFSVAAARSGGASPFQGSLLFAIVSLSAIAGRLFWGHLADRGGGERRRATLRDIGMVACVGALGYWGASFAGIEAQLPVMAVFAFGALGFNGVLYVVAGELAGRDRAGQAVGLASMVLFGGSTVAAVPLGRLADVAGYIALWPTAAALAALGVLVSLELPGGAPHAG